MPHRRIVPDTSVLLAAFFDETVEIGGVERDLSTPARAVLSAMLRGAVSAFAPDCLRYEFLKGAFGKLSARQGSVAAVAADVDAQVGRFLEDLDIVYIPSEAIAARAWALARRHAISPTDAWFVACAVHADAELWASHPQRDGFPDNARPELDRVCVLTHDRFA